VFLAAASGGRLPVSDVLSANRVQPWERLVELASPARTPRLPPPASAGTGESELTWQASAGIAYRFNWGDVSLLYRHLAWEFGSGDRLNDISGSGPLLAAKFVF
jgi:hypothetical protein